MKTRTLRINYIILLLFCFFVSNLSAQLSEYNHPELDWFTIDTEHFQVHYHNGANRTAQVVAKIAEDIYEPITSLYDWQPDGKIHFIIKDYEDNSNGAAFYYDNKVEIWAPHMTFILRGTHNWLRNVVTHEFSHMISLGAARKLTRRIPAFYFQLFNYEDEKRPDVLYGYPNIIASYPISMTVMPMWLAEGMAQYQTPGLDYERWDSHRDMLIRTAVVAGKMHSYDEMGVFGKNSLGNERTYNAGYALTRYIAANWGKEAVSNLARAAKKKTRFSIDASIKEVTNLDAKTLYNQWRNQLDDYYAEKLSLISTNRVEGTILTKEGIGNTYPTWNSSGDKLVFCGSKSSDYLTLTSLILYDKKTTRFKVLQGGINSKISWSNDDQKLVYARKRTTKHQSSYYDIHVYDFKTKKEKRLTHGLRAFEPNWSPDGEKIICITQKDGTDNLIIVNNNGKVLKQLTDNSLGEELYAPQWSPDGKWIVYSKGRNHGRDINMLNIATGEIQPLVSNIGDARDPVFSPDGKSIYFSWDKTGIFNIYSISLDDFSTNQWTNVIGGAFMPAISKDGGLAFSNFENDGYKISLLTSPQHIENKTAEYLAADHMNKLGLNNGYDSEVKEQYVTIREYDDTSLPKKKNHPYNMTYGQVSFLPRVFVDSSRVKLGTYFYASDILDRYSVLGGVAINTRKDLDAYALFEYRRLAPTLFLELYAKTLNIPENIEVIEDFPEDSRVDIHFNLLEADLGASYRFNETHKIRAALIHSRYTSKISDFFFQGIEWTSPRNTYFIGNHLRATWTVDMLARDAFSNINPSLGRKIKLTYTGEYNKFFKDFATDNDYNTPQEVYTNYNYNRLELNWREHIQMPWSRKHAFSADIKAGWVDRPIDSFFNFFAGGLPGLRGYPFYSIEGRKLLMVRTSYRFPIFSHWQKRFFHLTTDKMFLGFFFDYGNAFDKDDLNFSDFKKNIGTDLRFSAFSFYGFPTALSLQAAYGLDEVINDNVKYGKEWRYYLTLLFDFDLFAESF